MSAELLQLPREMHSDLSQHPAVLRAGLGGLGPFVLCGSWTSAHGETGLLPEDVARQHGSAESIAALLEAGLWTDTGGGYRMEYGPGSDWPLPLWRYGDDPGTGALLSWLPEPDT